MVSTLMSYFRYALILLVVAVLVSVGLVFDISHSELPETQLGDLEAQTYLMSVREIANTSEGESAVIVLSPVEASYLFERYHPNWSSYGLTLQDIYIEAEGELSRVRGVFSTPLGIYLRVDFQGKFNLDSKTWTVRPHGLRLGLLPVDLLLPSNYRPGWPSEFPEYGIELRSMKLDGRGLRFEVVNRGWEIEFTDNLINRFFSAVP